MYRFINLKFSNTLKQISQCHESCKSFRKTFNSLYKTSINCQPMIGGGGFQLSAVAPPASAGFRRYPPLVCTLTKQGQRFLTSLAAAEEASAAGLVRKFAASSSKHVALTTLSHLLSPSNSHPRLSSLAFPVSFC